VWATERLKEKIKLLISQRHLMLCGVNSLGCSQVNCCT